MLKSKLKKLTTFKRRRREPRSMGNCAGSSETAGERRSPPKPACTDHNNYTHGELVLKVLVEVNRLSSEDGALRWQPVLESLVPLSVHYIQIDQSCMFKLEASGVDGRSFQAEIKVPGTRIQKSSVKFIQWKDEENGGAWGLNFMCESDADNFFRSCSASPEDTSSSTPPISAPGPDPPPLLKDTHPIVSGPALQPPAPEEAAPIKSENTGDTNMTMRGDDEENQCGEEMVTDLDNTADITDNDDITADIQVPNSLQNGEASFEMSAGSVKSEGELSSDSESMELFQPSSPFTIKEEFILPDIMEETEEVETDSVHNTIDTSIQEFDRSSMHSSLNDGDLDIKETSFNETTLPALSLAFESLPSIGESDTNPNLDPPMLPVSPPPGPLLSSELNVVADAHEQPPYKGGYDTGAGKSYRHSVAGTLEDMPPPLPLTGPPGKMISPRHSRFIDLADLSTDLESKSRELDVSQLVLKMSRVAEDEEPPKQNLDEEKVSETQSAKSDEILPPQPQDYPDGDFDASDPSIIRQRLGSYHLKTFEPPKEFSDSGFQDTDVNISPKPILVVTKPFASDKLVSPLSALTQKVDSSVTGTSDEQLTENSSVGLKTVASSGSENSAFDNTADSGSHVIAETELKEAVTETTLAMAHDMEHSHVFSTTPATLSIIRKTGWLEMKTVLVSKNRKVAPKSKRKWKKYWANLKRSTLFLYECEEQSTLPEMETMHSDLKLDLECSLAHAVHDHVKRDHLFCLSTSSGNTYYMQTTSQAEVEEWITCLHCAAAIASTQTDKDHSVPVLMAKVDILNRKIEKENQLKNLTSLNLNAALESATKSMASDKLVECSENLEAFKVEVYRIRCYIASLQGTELPNPQSLLGSISKPTKSLLGRIGIFSVASLHAIVSARHNGHTSASTTSLHFPRTTKLKEKLSSLPRSPRKSRRGSLDISGPYSSTSMLTWGKSSLSKASSLPPGLKGSVSLKSFEISGPYPRMPSPDKHSRGRGRKFSLDLESSSPVSKRSMEISGPYLLPPKSLASLTAKPCVPSHSDQEERTGDEMDDYLDGGPPAMSLLNVVTVRIPSGKHSGGQVIQLTMRNDATARQLLCTVCEKFKFNSADHFLRLKLINEEGTKYFIPENDDIIIQQHYTEIEICQKSLKTVTLTIDRTERKSEMFGLTLVPEWDANTEIDLQSVLVEGVREGSVANRKEIRKGDELALVSGKSVMELGWVEVERLMSGQEVTVTVRTCRADAPLSHFSTNRILDGLICPAPPTSHPEISGEMLKNLVIPTPSVGDSSLHENGSDITDLSQDQIEHLLKDTNEISKLLRTWQSQQTEEAASVPWTVEDKLRKRISDLIETEADYVRLLNVLVERYFEPLRHESHLSQYEVKNLIGNTVELVQLQNSLLDDLKKAWQSESDSGTPDSQSLKHVVLQVARVFLKHVGHFKQYSSFCASHQTVKRLLAADENKGLIEFFRVRNPTTNASLNVDSLLTKPIVRVSRYPLFLNAIVDNTPKGSEENLRLKELIKEMGVVADHMNEMQRLCETYWPLIHSLSNNPKLAEIGVAVRITDLKYHGDVTWLNPSIEGLSKGWKKGQGPRMTIFVFKSSVVLICLDRKHKRKESKGIHEIRIEEEDIKYRAIIPAVECSISNLPDSDGVTNMWRFQHHRTRISSGLGLIYFFRSKSSEDKTAATDSIQYSIHEQQLLYGSPSINRATSPTRISPVTLQASPYQRLWRTTSPSPSALSNVSPRSTATGGTGTASDTDHD